MEIVKNNIRLYYKQIKQDNAKNTYIFIHGTGADHSQLDPQFCYFAKSNNVLSLDLRGHGRSDKPNVDYTLEEYAKDIVWLIDQLKIEAPILVGSSMGGNVAVELAASFPQIACGLVLLDSSLLYPQHFLPVLRNVQIGLRQDNYQDYIRQIYRGGCLPTDRYQEILENLLVSTPQHVWQSTVDNMLLWDDTKAKTALENCKLPILYLAATDIITNLELFKKLCPQLLIGQTIGSGHIISLEVPDQVNSMVEQFTNVYINAK